MTFVAIALRVDYFTPFYLLFCEQLYNINLKWTIKSNYRQKNKIKQLWVFLVKSTATKQKMPPPTAMQSRPTNQITVIHHVTLRPAHNLQGWWVSCKQQIFPLYFYRNFQIFYQHGQLTWKILGIALNAPVRHPFCNFYSKNIQYDLSCCRNDTHFP